MTKLTACTISPANPTNVCAGETVHFALNGTTGTGTAPFTYFWQEYTTGWANRSDTTNTSTWDLATKVGTTIIRLGITDSNSTPDTVYSAQVNVVATSVYDTFGAGLTTIHSDLATTNGYLLIVKKAVQ